MPYKKFHKRVQANSHDDALSCSHPSNTANCDRQEQAVTCQDNMHELHQVCDTRTASKHEEQHYGKQCNAWGALPSFRLRPLLGTNLTQQPPKQQNMASSILAKYDPTPQMTRRLVAFSHDSHTQKQASPRAQQQQQPRGCLSRGRQVSAWEDRQALEDRRGYPEGGKKTQ